MGYSIIYETKIIQLKDGRLLHLSLDGCNNDTSGRSRDDFTAKIYTPDDFSAKIEALKENNEPFSKSCFFTIKIGRRPCTEYDYAVHLERMLKRAWSWERLNLERETRFQRLEGIQVWKDREPPVLLTAKEFNEYRDKHKDFKYRLLFTALNDEEDVAEAIDKNRDLKIFIGKGGRL